MARKSRHTIDHILVETLGSGRTQTEAASVAGVSPRTVSRRLEDPEFVRRVEQFRDSLLETGAARLCSMISLATATLEKLLTDDVPAATRLGAAKTILDSAFRVRDVASLEKHSCYCCFRGHQTAAPLKRFWNVPLATLSFLSGSCLHPSDRQGRRQAQATTESDDSWPDVHWVTVTDLKRNRIYSACGGMEFRPVARHCLR